ncbi:extracellular solute-binding protein [Occultella glacieicola]|uniref:Extracellular solute-binding protein n=1 Tax=Occultella glacieicola TaxID=2518684 RepID=A0ABY2DXS0_9MICO|nr:extracellular solute-binding protein [Occultella glacieicola]TDE88915.1 extracellular solute-binding protein [Occultella glacieicola]
MPQPPLLRLPVGGRRRRTARVGGVAVVLVLAAAACSGGTGFTDETPTGADDGVDDGTVTVLIGSSGAAETEAVEAAVSAWSSESGIRAEVIVAADLNQQLSQGFAAAEPPDVFYLGTDQFAAHADNGSLHPYLDALPQAADFYPSLLRSFTYAGTTYCAPKDFSTLALIINTDYWAAAGLTDADLPTTWAQLREVATALTTDTHVGLSFAPEWQRIGAFLAEAGGSLTSPDNDRATVDSPENLEALEYVQDLIGSGVAAFPSTLNTGWGGEALGSGSAAMVVEGNWIVGAMAADFPDVRYRVVELPEGPGGRGTLQFTNCWGVAAGTDTEAAVELVADLTSPQAQLAFADAYGVMPSVATAAQQWSGDHPDQAAFLAGADYAHGFPSAPGAAAVLADFNAQLEGLPDADPADILASVHVDLQAVLGG